jgi:hypothetical protein
MKEMSNAYRNLVVKPEETRPLRGVDERVILKLLLKKRALGHGLSLTSSGKFFGLFSNCQLLKKDSLP